MPNPQKPQLKRDAMPGARRIAALLCATLVSASLAPGCASSTYRTRHPELLVMQMQMGTPVYVVERRTYNGSPLSGGLTQAVAGVPQARELAEASHDSMVAFLVTYLGGVIIASAGAAMLVSSQTSMGGQGQMGSAGSSVLLGGLVGVGSSIWFATRAEALRTDAVAAYNDAVLDRLRSSSTPPPAIPSEGPPGD
jgi:hypothetical protein